MSTTSQEIVINKKDTKTVKERKQETQEQTLLDNLSKGISYYKKRTDTLIIAVLVSLVAILILAGIISYMVFNKTKPVYFAQKEDLTITQMVPLDEPYLIDASVAQWAADCTRKTFSLDFSHIQEDLSNARICYVQKAFEQLLKVMEKEGIIDLIKTEHLNTEMTITTPAVVTKRGVVDGVMAWIIEFKFILSFFSSQGLANTQKMVAQVVVQRTKTTDYPKGVIIRQLIVSPE